ncbi:auxin-responsive protein SAUR76-like [Lycium ferocissimum]|uniref:auxin-responsive protein SAUR76-like n=1 Tax=Lycium ferocissimum TaxID=112874 RepID=UPI002815BAFE|nr:auxin-responsive protein SAUR76-like [Lycium ferocissimum]
MNLPPSFSQTPTLIQFKQKLSLFSSFFLSSTRKKKVAMTKGGKLTKIKSVLKKMQSFKLSRVNSINNTIMMTTSHNSSLDDDSYNSYDDNNNNNNNLHPVYVGKSRRRYLVTSDVVDHPLFRELVERTGGSDDYVTVGCEVVLFEHLLWMLQNADPQPESLDELVEFYSC